MSIESGLPGWFPEDFNVDDELLAAFEPVPGKKKKNKNVGKNAQELTTAESSTKEA